MTTGYDVWMERRWWYESNVEVISVDGPANNLLVGGAVLRPGREADLVLDLRTFKLLKSRYTPLDLSPERIAKELTRCLSYEDRILLLV